MRITLLVLSLVAFIAGVVFLSQARTPVHEIQAFLLFVVAATLLSASAVIEALTSGFTRVDKMNNLLVGLSKKVSAGSPSSNLQQNPVAGGDEQHYWVQTGTDSNGPFPVTKIRELHRRGAIDDDTPVSVEGGKNWQRARDVIGSEASRPTNGVQPKNQIG